MRIYIPLVASELAADVITPRLSHAVTDDLRRAVPSEDQEGHEYISFLAAADDSLRMLTSDGALSRVVVAAEVPESCIELPAKDEKVLPTAVYLTSGVAWDRVDSIHVDEPEAREVLSRAVAGDDAAFDQSVDYDLLWHDVSERAVLASSLGGSPA